MKENIYFKLFISFLKAGLFTIGGGLAMLPLIQKYVLKEKWLNEEEMLDAVAVAQSLPGVFAVNIATYIGKKCAGVKGSLAAACGAILPSFVIIIAISVVLGRVDDNIYVSGALTAIKAAAAALILLAGIKLSKNVLKKAWTYFLAAASFALIIFLDVNVIAVILSAVAIGIAAGIKGGSR